MKKIISILLLLYVAPLTTNSQALVALLLGDKIKSNKVKIGIFLGEQSSYITDANTVTFKPNLSFTIGTYIDVKMKKNNKWILQNYIIFKSPKGADGLDVSKESISDNIVLNENMKMLRRNITYFQLTPVIRFCFTSSWLLGIGPYAGFKILVKDTYSTKKDDGDLTYKLKKNSDFSTLDTGIAFDIQCRLIKGNGIQLNLRYEQGFTNIYKSNLDRKGHNMAFHFGVGIPVDKK